MENQNPTTHPTTNELIHEARAILERDPEETEAVQEIDDRIAEVQATKEEVDSLLDPYREAVREARARVQETADELDELRVDVVLGDADESEEAALERGLEENEAALSNAESKLEDARRKVQPRLEAHDKALTKLRAERADRVQEAHKERVEEAGAAVGNLDLVAADALCTAYHATQAAKKVRTVVGTWVQRHETGYTKPTHVRGIHNGSQHLTTILYNEHDARTDIKRKEFEVTPFEPEIAA